MVLDQSFYDYQKPEGPFDEYYESPGKLLSHIEKLVSSLQKFSKENILEIQKEAEKLFRRRGITFQVYGRGDEKENIFPFDIIPRIISSKEWEITEKGLLQRVTALNFFLNDIYNEQKILKEKIIPSDLIHTSKSLVTQARGLTPPGDVYIHVAGIDLVRTPNGQFHVLEDNLRCPSGISYVLENREIMKDLFPELFDGQTIRSIYQYPTNLRLALSSLTGKEDRETSSVLLTPGPYNSAFFEHVFLARKMGYELVTADDLFVQNDKLYLKTYSGPRLVDVVYRRIDDDFIDPKFFRKDSLLGVPGLFQVYARGNVILANAIGNSIADDKAIYPYVPKMIEFYLSENPILPQIETYNCFFENERRHVLANLRNLVIKNVNASGGYDIFFGTTATNGEMEEVAERINTMPRKYIAQPVVEISVCPTFEDGKVIPKRLDFRPFIVTGTQSKVIAGGLTRVALKKNSYIVNSSQGGGSKDTWILQDKLR